METNKELGPFKIHISIDGLTPEEEQYIISSLKCKLNDVKFLGLPMPFSDHYYKTTYKVPNDNIANYLYRAIYSLHLYNEKRNI